MSDKPITVAMLNDGVWATRHKETRRVFSTLGIAPTITAGGGGGVEPKIITYESTYVRNEIGDDEQYVQ